VILIPGSEQPSRDGKPRSLADVDFSVDIPLDVALDLAEILKELTIASALPSDVDLGSLAFKMTMKGSETMDGSAQVDVDTGLPVAFDTKVAMKMAMELTDVPADLVPEDQRGPFTVDLTADARISEVR
jgi:hypothetical protein